MIFIISVDKFKYQGINITRNPKLLFKSNYLELIDTLKSKIEKWRLLPLSLIGRVNIIKMIVLPKFTYLFQNVLVFLTSSFFKLLDSIIMPFIWANKPARIAKVHLQKPPSEGGLGLPVFRHYYWACNVRTWIFWNHILARIERANTLYPSWPLIERDKAAQLTEASLSAILFSNVNLPSKQLKDDFILCNTYKILKQIRGVLGLPG